MVLLNIGTSEWWLSALEETSSRYFSGLKVTAKNANATNALNDISHGTSLFWFLGRFYPALLHIRWRTFDEKVVQVSVDQQSVNDQSRGSVENELCTCLNRIKSSHGPTN